MRFRVESASGRYGDRGLALFRLEENDEGGLDLRGGAGGDDSFFILALNPGQPILLYSGVKGNAVGMPTDDDGFVVVEEDEEI